MLLVERHLFFKTSKNKQEILDFDLKNIFFLMNLKQCNSCGYLF